MEKGSLVSLESHIMQSVTSNSITVSHHRLTSREDFSVLRRIRERRRGERKKKEKGKKIKRSNGMGIKSPK